MSINSIKKVWFDNNYFLAKQPSSVEMIDIEERLASIFCPGPFYYYIFDFSIYEFITVSKNYKDIIGLDPTILTIDQLLSRIHPDDIDFFTKCEEKIAYFLFEYLSPKQILNYKISYCFRNLTSNGTYKLFLHQVTSLSLDKEGKLERVLGVHSDISHITTASSKRLSLLGLNGQPSYLNIDVFQQNITLESSVPNFTKREIQVLRHLAEGASSKEIANHLGLAEATITKHRENLLKKSKAKNTAQLINKTIKQGLI